MKQLLLFFALVLSFFCQAQILDNNQNSLPQEKISKCAVVKVFISSHEQIHELSQLHIDIDHYHGDHLTGLVLHLDERDLEILDASPFEYEILQITTQGGRECIARLVRNPAQSRESSKN